MAGEVHFAHPAFPQLAFDLISLAQKLTDQSAAGSCQRGAVTGAKDGVVAVLGAASGADLHRRFSKIIWVTGNLGSAKPKRQR